MSPTEHDFNYQTAGFDAFMSRSIDPPGSGTTLANLVPAYNPFFSNYNQQQVTGSLGNSLQIGSITMDGVNGKITIVDSNNNPVINIGSQAQ